MATKLSLYNGALRECGERKLASLSEATATRHWLDEVWDDGALDFCLEQKQWTFATRTVQLIANSDYEPEYGYAHIFNKPSDFIKTVALCSDDMFIQPYEDYAFEGEYIAAGIETLYLRYVSNDAAYGGNMASFSPSFNEMLRLHLAAKIVHLVSQDTNKIATVTKLYRDALKMAGTKDAFNRAAPKSPQGSWVRARMGGGCISG